MQNPVTIVCCHLSKGGCGKSQSVHAIGSFLSLRYPTLLVDLDSQISLTSAVVPDVPKYTAYEVLKKKVPLADAVTRVHSTYPENLYLLAGSHLLANLEAETLADLDRVFCLSDALAAHHDFRFVITGSSTAQSQAGSLQQRGLPRRFSACLRTEGCISSQ